MKRTWSIVALVAVGALLAGGFLGRRGVLRCAYGQSEGVTGRVMVVMGAPQGRFAPIVIVDTLEQSMIIYEYNYNSRRVELQCVRTYRYDKQLAEYKNEGVSVARVKAQLDASTRP